MTGTIIRNLKEEVLVSRTVIEFSATILRSGGAGGAYDAAFRVLLVAEDEATREDGVPRHVVSTWEQSPDRSASSCG